MRQPLRLLQKSEENTHAYNGQVSMKEFGPCPFSDNYNPGSVSYKQPHDIYRLPPRRLLGNPLLSGLPVFLQVEDLPQASHKCAAKAPTFLNPERVRNSRECKKLLLRKPLFSPYRMQAARSRSPPNLSPAEKELPLSYRSPREWRL